MARLLKSSFGLVVDLDGGVGSAGPNQREDVGAVQYALSILTAGAAGPAGSEGGGLFTVPGQAPIKVDGGYGRQTAAYIKAYQEKRKMLPAGGGNFLGEPTGQITPTRKPGAWGYGVLNEDVRVRTGKPLADLITSDPAAPPWLKAAFSL